MEPTLHCLHELIERQAQRSPQAEALVFEDERLTYAELDRRAELLATRLRELCEAPEARVGLFAERSAELVIAILATLKAGAAYVPLDISHPPERVEFLCSDAGVRVLLTDSHHLAQCPAGPAHAICLDTFDWFRDARAAWAPACKPRPQDLAYVIYTSGTTGRPKGVAVEHRNIVNYVLAISERLGLQPGMRHAHVSTFAADLGNTVLFPSLATGGGLHVISSERAQSQVRLSEYFGREKIDVLKITPSHLAALQAGRHPERVMPRRLLVLGGEFSRPDRIVRLRALTPKCEIWNHYGPTETTVGVLAYRAGSALPATLSGTLPVGTPLANVTTHIVPMQDSDAKDGKGELCIGGACVARGYLGRDELTAEKFVDWNGERVYRTGDLARRLPDGNIELCGRVDRQVKLHGYRIELDEIEAVLRSEAGIQDAVVLAHAKPSGEPYGLLAYIVPQQKYQPLWNAPSVYELPDGSSVAHLNKNETDYIYNEIFVLQAYLRHGISICDGDCIVDAGSNIGLFALFASRLAPRGRILAFEPNPAAFSCLESNAEASGAQVKCFRHGLARESRVAEMTFFEGFSLLSGFHADAATEKAVVRAYVANQQVGEAAAEQMSELIEEKMRARTVSAQLRPLSSVIAEENLERIDLLKVNVEKSELDVLLGIEDRDWVKIRQLVVEVDEQKSLAPILQLLVRHGYETLVEQDALLRNTELCYVYAIRPSPAGRLVRDERAGAHVRPLPAPPQAALAPLTLKKRLKRRLPGYMVPSAFALLDKLPLNANGKVDPQALAALRVEGNAQAPAPAAASAWPQSETEKKLGGLWSELLKIEAIGVHDDFFDLGGQSMMAIQLVARIRDAFGVDVALRNLFERPTLAALAELVDALRLSARPEESSGREEFVL